LSATKGKRFLLHSASLCALILGLLTKEFTFTAPISLMVMELFLFRIRWREAMVRMGGHLACLPLIPIALFILSNDLSELGLSVASATSISNFNDYSRIDYAITQMRVILSYFRLLVLPYGLNFDPEYTLFQRITQPEIMLSLLVWFSFGIAALKKLKNRGADIADDLAGFSIIWFPLLICVSSSIVPLPDIMSEHRTYLPSLAFCTGITAYIYSLCRNNSPIWNHRVVVATCAVLGTFCLLTLQRNQVYSSRLSLWSDTVAKSPTKARPALALGNAYLDLNQHDLAIVWLKRSIQLNPDYKEPYLSLGSIYSSLGRNMEAIALYESYLESHPPGRRVLTNLALAYYDIGMPNEAVACLKAALEVDPDDEMLHIILAENLFILGKAKEARKYIQKAKELDKANPVTDVTELIKMLEYNYDINPMPYKGTVRS
jgi:tetratricopeptide (TPR) repeat protein